VYAVQYGVWPYACVAAHAFTYSNIIFQQIKSSSSSGGRKQPGKPHNHKADETPSLAHDEEVGAGKNPNPQTTADNTNMNRKGLQNSADI